MPTQIYIYKIPDMAFGSKEHDSDRLHIYSISMLPATQTLITFITKVVNKETA